MKHSVAVFLGILFLGILVAFGLPPPALAHHHPVAHVHDLTATQPVMIAAEWPTVAPATYFVALVQTRASPVYAYAVFVRPDGAGHKPGGVRDSVASLSPPFTVLSAMPEKGFILPLARADPANLDSVFRGICARSPPMSVWT
jgi:hypothetical protein